MTDLRHKTITFDIRNYSYLWHRKCNILPPNSFHLFFKLIQHISVILHSFRCIIFDVGSRVPSIFIFVITFPVDKVFLTILSYLVINNPLDVVKGGYFVLWYVSLVLRIIVVMLEHVWSKDWVTKELEASRNVESEVDVFIDGSNLIRTAPDGLQFLSKVFLKGSPLVHD